MYGLGGNAQVQRASATLNVGTITAQTTKDVTFTDNNAVVGDRVVVNPAASGVASAAICDAFVSAASVVAVRFINVGTANTAAGTAVVVNYDLIKATGSI